MRLLILTQSVDENNPVLGFFISWINEFAKNCEQVIVVCLEKGVYELSTNVKVLSLGKENGRSKIKYIINFYRHIWQERKNYDTVFVHMNTQYIILGSIIWKMLNKKISLWYVHKRINWQLILAEKLADVIFTASKEGCQLNSEKIKIVGHGIKLNNYLNLRKHSVGNLFRIIYVGRISLIKNQLLLVQSAQILISKYQMNNFVIEFVGGTIYEKDKVYLSELKKAIIDLKLSDKVIFRGGVSNQETVKFYEASDLSINLCPTGGMDKSVLESMASGLPVIVFNKAFSKILDNYHEVTLLNQPDKLELAEKIYNFILPQSDAYKSIGEVLRTRVKEENDLDLVVQKIIKEISRL